MPVVGKIIIKALTEYLNAIVEEFGLMALTERTYKVIHERGYLYFQIFI
jgi:hypothetical protein